MRLARIVRIMKTYAKQQDSPLEFQWKCREKNLERLALWEQEDPLNIRFKFPGCEKMEHYDRVWVLGEIITNVGEVELHRISHTHIKLQSVHKNLAHTNSAGARE